MTCFFPSGAPLNDTLEVITPGRMRVAAPNAGDTESPDFAKVGLVFRLHVEPPNRHLPIGPDEFLFTRVHVGDHPTAVDVKTRMAAAESVGPQNAEVRAVIVKLRQAHFAVNDDVRRDVFAVGL